MGETVDEIRDVLGSNVRAALARQRISAAQVGRLLGHEKSWVYRRMIGETPWAAEDLMVMAEEFGLSTDELWRGIPGGRP